MVPRWSWCAVSSTAAASAAQPRSWCCPTATTHGRTAPEQSPAALGEGRPGAAPGGIADLRAQPGRRGVLRRVVLPEVREPCPGRTAGWWGAIATRLRPTRCARDPGWHWWVRCWISLPSWAPRTSWWCRSDMGAGPGSRSWRRLRTACPSSRRPSAARGSTWSTDGTCSWSTTRVDFATACARLLEDEPLRLRLAARPASCGPPGTGGRRSAPTHRGRRARCAGLSRRGPAGRCPGAAAGHRAGPGTADHRDHAAHVGPSAGSDSHRQPAGRGGPWSAGAAPLRARPRSSADRPWCIQQSVASGPTASAGSPSARTARPTQRKRIGECTDSPRNRHERAGGQHVAVRLALQADEGVAEQVHEVPQRHRPTAAPTPSRPRLPTSRR